MTARPLELPKHAWRSKLRGAPLSYFQAAIAFTSAFTGAAIVFAGLLGDMRVSGHSRWIGIPEGLAWIAVAAGIWVADQTLLRRSLALLMLCKGCALVVSMILIPELDRLMLTIAQAPAWIALGIGVWTAREWARKAIGVWGLLMYGYYLSSIVMGFGFRGRPLDEMGTAAMAITGVLAAVLLAGPPIALAIYSILPSTREHFAKTPRGSRRARAVTS